jgi:coenzyme F420-0:L-glutamate ligase / coenzyme F420-1:gamma-L-glutamate ligase
MTDRQSPSGSRAAQAAAVSVLALPGIPLIAAGDDLSAVIVAALDAAAIRLQDGDVVCVAQKIVSKAEGRLVKLSTVTAGPEAVALARETDKDPRLVQLVLDESTEVVRKKPGVLIVRHRLGLVGAHAGIDQSNIEHGEGIEGEFALLLPEDPDASARSLRDALERVSGRRLGVVITDSSNRPWRLGTIGAAIGCSGIRALDDRRGGTDLFGRELKVTLINRADSLATMATLVMGETTERTPVALVRGLPPDDVDEPARGMIRPLEEDMFR